MQHFRSWVGFGKLFPISTSKAIVEKHYRKNVKFARAEDEMRISLKNVMQARQSSKTICRKQSTIESPLTKSLTVQLTRLTAHEIAQALGENIRIMPTEVTSNDTGIAKYNLRNRK